MKKFVLLSIFSLIAFMAKAQSGYDLDRRILTEAELKNKCNDELWILRNEPYARKGYVFSNTKLLSYFSDETDLYEPKHDNNSVVLNDTEKRNIEIIKNIEEQREIRLTLVKDFVLKLQKHISSGDVVSFYKLLDLFSNNDNPEYMLPFRDDNDIYNTIKQLDGNNISYYKGEKAIYSQEINGGDKLITYTLSMEGNLFYISKTVNNSPENCIIFESDSYGEYAIRWNFEIRENNKIKFLGSTMAG